MIKNPINNGTNPNIVIPNIPDVNICHAKLDIIAATSLADAAEKVVQAATGRN